MTEIPLQNILQRFSSDILWHFVGRKDKDDSAKCFQILLSILGEGKLKLSTDNEQFIYHRRDGTEEKLYGHPVCCLADIPLKDLPLHSMRYGECAIGFHRKSAVKNHFMPVLLISQ